MRSIGARSLGLTAAVFLAASTEGNAQLDVDDICVASEAFAEVDFVFLIDATHSMGREIAAIRAGLGSFVTGLDPAEIDARFAVVLFGGAPELVQDFSYDPNATETTFNTINVGGAVPGFCLERFDDLLVKLLVVSVEGAIGEGFFQGGGEAACFLVAPGAFMLLAAGYKPDRSLDFRVRPGQLGLNPGVKPFVQFGRCLLCRARHQARVNEIIFLAIYVVFLPPANSPLTPSPRASSPGPVSGWRPRGAAT